MRELTTFGDPEWALAQAITSVLSEQNVAVEPIAGVLPAGLPPVSVHVEGLGGETPHPGVSLVEVKVNVRAESEMDARNLASLTHAALELLDEEQVDGDAQIVGVTPRQYPYLNPDPRNPKLVRFSQGAQLTVKAI